MEKSKTRGNETILVSSFGSSSSFRQIIWFHFPHLACTGSLLSVHAPLSQDGSRSEGFWEEQDSLWSGIVPWLLTHKEPFCTCVVPPSSRKWGEERSLNLFVKQDFTPLCPWHDYYLDYLCDYYLKEFTSDKHLLCTLFLHPFWRADRRLIVNVLTRAHLSLVLENANRCKYPAWNPLLHAPRNIN